MNIPELPQKKTNKQVFLILNLRDSELIYLRIVFMTVLKLRKKAFSQSECYSSKTSQRPSVTFHKLKCGFSVENLLVKLLVRN